MITLNQLKEWLGIDLGDTSQDAYLQGLIDEVSAYIETYTGRIFSINDYVTKLDGNAERILLAKNYPVNSIESIKYRESNDFTLGYTGTYDPKDYTFDINTGEIFFNFRLGRGFHLIELSYNAGYAEIPLDIQLGVKKLCEDTYLANKNQGVISENVDGTGIRFTDFLKNTQVNMRIFDKYKSYEL